MKRIHFILPCLLLAGAALLGAQALAGSLPLGLSSSSGKTTVAADATAVAADDAVSAEVAQRTAALELAQKQLAQLVAKPLPKLPPVPKSSPVRQQVLYTYVAAPTSVQRSAPTLPSSNAGRHSPGSSSTHHESDGGGSQRQYLNSQTTSISGSGANHEDL